MYSYILFEMKIKIYLLSVCVLLSSINLLAADVAVDSVELKNKKVVPVYKETPWRLAVLSAPSVITGFSMIGYEKDLMKSRSEHTPMNDANVDDYMRCAPAALLLGLKLGGVKSRSSWGRMLVSDAFSGVLMYGISESLKRSVGVPRPNGMNDKSFPSGHTAMAFMFAAMVDKEFGTINKFYSLIGYSLATCTAVSRIVNYKHQVGDVLAGAGIGILSTELGYFFADLIFKDRGLHYYADKRLAYISPNWVGIDFGAAFGFTDYKLADSSISIGNGSVAKVSSGYFFNKCLGIGGNVGYSKYTISQNGEFANQYLDCISVTAGPQFSYNTDINIRLGVNANIGYVHYLKSQISDKFSIGDKGGYKFELGAHAAIPMAENYSMRVFCNYDLSGSCISGNVKPVNSLSFGTSIVANF